MVFKDFKKSETFDGYITNERIGLKTKPYIFGIVFVFNIILFKIQTVESG